MRSFREVAYNFQKPIADLNANAVTAGLGTMNPIVDLQAQKEITKSESLSLTEEDDIEAKQGMSDFEREIMEAKDNDKCKDIRCEVARMIVFLCK